MKLTVEDKQLLIEWGFKKEDFKQIERAINKTKYELDNRLISKEQALEVLGRENFLSGIARSAFHWSALRDNEQGQSIYFNSSKLFK